MEQPKIIDRKPSKLIGMKIITSLSENKTFELWYGFKKRIKEIENRTDANFYSVQIFDKNQDFETFTPTTIFEKWAAVEVEDFENIPDGMEKLHLKGGKYAIFIHKGTHAMYPKTQQFIFGFWLPNSEYELDAREHFEISGADYNPNDENAEEEIWIPIKNK